MNFGLVSLGGTSSKLILKEAKNLFKKVKPINIKNVEVHTNPKELTVLYDGKVLEHFDCLMVRGSYKYALLQRAITSARYKTSYMPLAPESFSLGHDKFRTALELQKANINIPTTYLAATTKSAKKLLEKVNYPVIMKIPSGTQGKGVMFADSITSAKSILDTLEIFKQPYIIQEYIETGATDIRALVVGDKVVASMSRKAASNEVRANIHLGAKGINYELDPDTENIAIRSAKAVRADICAIDILEGTKPTVIEVNLSPGLSGLMEATKENIPRIIAKFLFEKTEEFTKKQKERETSEIIKTIETDSKNGSVREAIANVNVKAGIIKLPKIMTDVTGFKDEDEVIFTAKKGKLTIEKH